MTWRCSSEGWSRRLLAAALSLLAFGAWGAGSSDAARSPHPAVDFITAAPKIVAGRGGSVVVRVRVEHAVHCAFRGQRLAFASLKLLRTVNCRSGHASLRVPIAANEYKSSVALHFSVTASDAHAQSDHASVQVVQAAKTAPPKPTPVAPLVLTSTTVPNGVLNLSYSVSLTASGGEAPYSWSVASGALPPGIALSGDGDLAGTPTAAGQFAFTVQVADTRGRTATVPLSIAISGSHVPAVPSAPTLNSTNWSGYALAGGPFTSAAGTFNVPTVTGNGSDSSAAEWVGIDGWGPGESSIIQAGVAEDYSASFNTVRITAWYELYPAPAFEIPLAVATGDRVSVSIAEVSAETWDVLVADNTTNQSYNAEFGYAGPAGTAEWVVEAPFSTITQSVIPLAPFSPVTFTQLAATPTGAPATRFVMIQSGQQVSTPSPLTDNGFTVGYGGVTPAAP